MLKVIQLRWASVTNWAAFWPPPHNLRDRAFYGLLMKAGLRQVRFHDLRHTYVSFLLQNNESLLYVKDQMGHCTIQVTADLYGRLIPGGNKQAVDRLDTLVLGDESATRVQPLSAGTIPQVADQWNNPVVTRKGIGVSDGLRTRSLLSHSQALYP